MKKQLTQKKINLINMSIAALALLISLPSGINQLKDFFDDINKESSTNVVFYDAPDKATAKVISADKCWGSNVSKRFDAYRCIAGNSIQDPCFWIEEYGSSTKERFYCPSKEVYSPSDSVLELEEQNVDRQFLQDSKPIDVNKDLPWMIYLKSGISCRLGSGALGTAYADKGNLYSCNSDRIMSVTNGEVRSGKHYFMCKFSGDSIFKECIAKLIIY